MSQDYLWRGGQKILLQKEPEFFTTIIPDSHIYQEVASIDGIKDIQQVHHQIYKVQIEENQLNSAMTQIRSQSIRGICHHAYYPLNDRTTRYYLTEEIIIRFDPGTPAKRIEQLLETHALTFVREFGTNHTYLFRLTRSTGINPVKCSNLLAELPEVLYAEPNLINRFASQDAAPPPSDELFSQQWHLDNKGGLQLVEGADVDILEAWAITKGSRDVVVAVIDDGFDLSHPDLSGENKIVAPKDYVDGDASPFPENRMGDYHGTPCAGVAIAEENGTGVVGAAPNCAFTPIRFDLRAGDEELWEIFDHASRFADVISCSWGPIPVYAPLSSLIFDKFKEITESGGPRGKGALILFASGNYNAPLFDPENESFEYFDPRYGTRRIPGPILNGNAAHPDVMAIAASTSLNRKSAYSNWGKEISVAAPSNNFHPIDQQIWVPGRGITTTDNEAQGQGFRPNSRYTSNFGGTSSATPLVAGIAALVISAYPELTAREVRQILEETTDKIVDNEPDIVLGNTKGTYDENGKSEWFGFGKVNAGRAVRKALSLKNEAEEEKQEEDFDNRLISGSIDTSGGSRMYEFRVQNYLYLNLIGPESADFDLYVRRDAPPTLSNFDVRASALDSTEEILIDNARPGNYMVMVKSYSGVGNFDLEVRFRP